MCKILILMTSESICSLDVVLLECTENMPDDIQCLPYWKPFMKKGWKTWTSRDYYDSRHDGLLVIEDNFYEINFPTSLFKEIN